MATYPQEPTILQKMKMGALMGSSVGLCIGLVFGCSHLMRAGPGSKGYFGTLGQYMMGSAASFGFFMSIGSVVRSEGFVPLNNAGPYRRMHVIRSSSSPSHFHHPSTSNHTSASSAPSPIASLASFSAAKET